MKVKVQFDLHEQVPTTTAGVPYVPFPFPGALVLQPQDLVNAGQVKAQEACRKAMLAYVQGRAKKAEVDRICGGMKR